MVDGRKPLGGLARHRLECGSAMGALGACALSLTGLLLASSQPVRSGELLQEQPQPDVTNPTKTPNAFKNDCGLRAVAHVLINAGLKPSDQELRLLVSHRYASTAGLPQGEGYSLADLGVVFAHYGIESRAGRAPLTLIQRWQGTAILRLPGKAGGHFIVVEPGSDPAQATVYDPSLGRLSMRWAVLARRWPASQPQAVALFVQNSLTS